MPWTSQIDGTPTRKTLSLQMIDRYGNKASLSLGRDFGAASPAQADAFATAYGAETCANVYRADFGGIFASAPNVGAADTGSHDDTAKGINLLFKNPDGDSETIRLYAPRNDMFSPLGSENISLSALGDLISACLVFLNLSKSGWSFDSAQFTSRKGYTENNPRVRA